MGKREKEKRKGREGVKSGEKEKRGRKDKGKGKGRKTRRCRHLKFLATPLSTRAIQHLTTGIGPTGKIDMRGVLVDVEEGGLTSVSYTHSEPTRQAEISYAVFCLKKKRKKKLQQNRSPSENYRFRAD